MKTIAVLQARMSSTRLPGKVLKPILGLPMLEHQIARLGRSRLIDKLIVATSIEKDDLAISRLCDKMEVECFRGSLNDVLDRYYQAVKSYRPTTVVRLTGDCPLADPGIIDGAIDFYRKNDFDYVSNCIKRTFPIGLDVEVFGFKPLQRAWCDAFLPSEREHVTPYIKNHPELFAVGHYKNDTDLSHHRWTVDEPDDFRFVTAVYEALYDKKPDFSMKDILELLQNRPELTEINYHIEHGEGYQKSLRQDAQYLARRPVTES